MSDRHAGWIRIGSIEGGWFVSCGLCGKRFTRTFMGSLTNYAEAEMASRDYATTHALSDAHKAAVAAFHSDPPEVTKEERRLGEIFASLLPTDMERRKSAAKRAAAEAERLSQSRGSGG